MAAKAMENSVVVGRAAAMKGARTWLAAGALLLAGCGINAIRTEYAGKVGSQGSAVAAASSEFLERVEEKEGKNSESWTRAAKEVNTVQRQLAVLDSKFALLKARLALKDPSRFQRLANERSTALDLGIARH